VEHLRGDPTKAVTRLGWQAEVTLEQLASEMVEADIARLKARM